MEKDALEDLYVSVRPYLYDASMIRDFLDKNSEHDIDEIMLEAEKMISSSEGTIRTDFQILYNAMNKR